MKPTDPITDHFQLKDAQQKALKRLGLVTIHDLLYHFPTRYGDATHVKTISQLSDGDQATIYGQLIKIETGKTQRGVPVAKGRVRDDTGTVDIIWFRQPYIAKQLYENTHVKVDGVVSERKTGFSLTNPEIQMVEDVPLVTGDSLFGEGGAVFGYPVYRESRGITSKWMYHALQRVFASNILEDITDPIPKDILKSYNLPTIRTALLWIHTPQKQADSEAARKRFAFEEIFYIQCAKQLERKKHEDNPSFIIDKTLNDISDFTDRFSFDLTESQTKATKAILSDMSTPVAMSRLLEGDVGSGKTAVAAVTAHAVVTTPPLKRGSSKMSALAQMEADADERQDFGNLQVAYMAPTEILARQHFETFVELFAHLPIQIGLITSSGCMKFPSKVSPGEATSISRKKLLEWVANGEIPILIGTHSLIQKSVTFENLAYVIIDEQHRFGTKQRFNLRAKHDVLPHLLSMTATPIPRTLALTIYGDLDITLLDQAPRGRKQIQTRIVLPDERDDMYDFIRQNIKDGRQAYVICPRINDGDPANEKAILAKSVETEAERLRKKVFPDLIIEELHGKMGPQKKEKALKRFANGDAHILVATSVVEVGVNVPNATMIIIEGAERFGLAQLHQLRGRVMRSDHQPYCFVFTESSSKKTKERLLALTQARNGFELAEYDLAQRGAGELAGRSQSGITDIGMEAIRNIKMVEAARTEAQKLVDKDPKLATAPLLAQHIAERDAMHEE